VSLGREASLVDVAFAVCTALDRTGNIAVLTGGSAATYYDSERYQSMDADFVLQVVPQRHVVEEAMASLGYYQLADRAARR
jgi:hypothetical protein